MLKFSDGDLLEDVIHKKTKKQGLLYNYYTSMSCYVDLAVDVSKLSQFDKIKEILKLASAFLADSVDFGYKKMLYKQRMKERAMHLKLVI